MGPYRSPTGKHAAHPPSRAAAAEGIHNTRRCERSNRRGRGESQDHKSRAPASRWALPSAPALTRSAMPEHQRQIAIPQRRRPRSNLFSSASLAVPFLSRGTWREACPAKRVTLHRNFEFGRRTSRALCKYGKAPWGRTSSASFCTGKWHACSDA
jgi:hypothetical protein